MSTKKPIVMDVDTGVDDTLAFLLVAANECLDLRAITTVFGNCAVDVTTKNTLKISRRIQTCCRSCYRLLWCSHGRYSRP